MATNRPPRKRGRTPTHPVDKFKTRLWFNVVKEVSGLPSAHAIEMELDGELVRARATDVARTKKWYEYKKGKTVPDDRPGPRNAIDQAEARFPGTAHWFRSPLWIYLKKEEPFDEWQIEDALRSLDPDVVAILFEPEIQEGET
jgi:hypothetical protein